MNNQSVNPDKQFEELVESYLDGSISAEQSKALLEMIQSDATKRSEFGAQVQMAELLSVKEGQEDTSINEKIMALLAGAPVTVPVKQPRPFNWSRALVRIAAVLMVVVGLSYVIKMKFEGQTIADKETAPLQKDTDSLIAGGMADTIVQRPKEEREEGAAQAAPTPQEFDVVMNAKSPVIVKNVNGSTRSGGQRANGEDRKVSSAQSAADYKDGDLAVREVPAGAKPDQDGRQDEEERVMVPLKIELPKPQFTGSPKDIRSANLESSAERMARPQGGSVADLSQVQATDAPASRRDERYRMPPIPPPSQPTGEGYAKIEENEFLSPSEKPLSTFSIDVDTASYSNMRRFITQGQLPPADAVRVEEMINYFEYNYEAPGDAAPFSAAMALHSCPWNPEHQLLRVGLQGRKMNADNRKPSNLVFLLDVSGSMDTPDKLPLLKTGMTMLVNALTDNDRVALVVYAGSSGLVLDSTSAAEKGKIIEAMQRLSAGGSTAGGAGIELAYRVAVDNYIQGGINRVILATDGDFNVGTSSLNGLQTLIEQKRASGVFLSVLGFGTGNLQDSKMELLANKGNGNYFYIDTEREARKVLVEQLHANLVTIAKDVKIQIEFNPEYVRQYRLIGYENRKMAARDFDDDKKDAGEIGAGHQVTALYEIIPIGAPDVYDGVNLKYGKKGEQAPEPKSNEMLTLKLRYKEPEGETSRLLSFPLAKGAMQRGAGDQSFRWAAAVAAFGQILRGSPHVGSYSINDVRVLAGDAKGDDPNGYRREFITLLERAERLKGSSPATNDKGYPLWQYRN